MILISPYSKLLRNGKISPKNYPYWKEVLTALKGEDIVQIGAGNEDKLINGNPNLKFVKGLPFAEIGELVKQCRVWVSVDNFLPHLAHHIGKPGVVVWGQSDPTIFGYKENINLLKDRSYLRKDQFQIWESCEYNKEAFVSSKEVIEAIRRLL
jgi:ADP-heptose:LPS heptosyltransferase